MDQQRARGQDAMGWPGGRVQRELEIAKGRVVIACSARCVGGSCRWGFERCLLRDGVAEPRPITAILGTAEKCNIRKKSRPSCCSSVRTFKSEPLPRYAHALTDTTCFAGLSLDALPRSSPASRTGAFRSTLHTMRDSSRRPSTADICHESNGKLAKDRHGLDQETDEPEIHSR